MTEPPVVGDGSTYDLGTDLGRSTLMSWFLQWWRAADLAAQMITPVLGSFDRQAAALLFATATRNVERAGAAIVGEDHPAMVAYHQAVPAVVDVRDMLEHFDAYLANTGKLQKKKTVTGFTVFFAHDGQSLTLHVGGLSIRVEDARAAARQLMIAVEDELSQ